MAVRPDTVADVVKPDGTVDETVLRDTLGRLQERSRVTTETDWVRVLAGDSFAFEHRQDEIPWMCDVIASYDAGGGASFTPASGVTSVKTARDVTVTNGTSEDLFLQVRVM